MREKDWWAVVGVPSGRRTERGGRVVEVTDDSTPRLMDTLYQGIEDGQTPPLRSRCQAFLAAFRQQIWVAVLLGAIPDLFQPLNQNESDLREARSCFLNGVRKRRGFDSRSEKNSARAKARRYFSAVWGTTEVMPQKKQGFRQTSALGSVLSRLAAERNPTQRVPRRGTGLSRRIRHPRNVSFIVCRQRRWTTVTRHL